MTRAHHGIRLGAAVFVAGLSLAGPHALGVAAAEGSEDSSVSTTESSPGSAKSPTKRGTAAGSRAPVRAGAESARVLTPRPAASSQAGTASADELEDAPAPVRAAARRGSDAPVRTRAADPARALEAAPSRQSEATSGLVLAPRVALAPAVALAPVALAPRAAVADPAPSASALVPAGGLVTSWVAPAPTALAAATAAPAPAAAVVGQRMGGLASAVKNLLDSVGQFLSSFGNPITDLMSGALWLVRKTIFPVGSDVGLWGSAPCVNTGDCSGKDLSGAILRNQYLPGVKFQSTTLTKADLRNTNLTGSDMSGAYMRDAALDAADLDGVDLYTAYMTGVSATNTSLVGADLVSANLTDANFSGADLEMADLGGAVLTGVEWGNAVCPDGSQGGCHGPVAAVESNPGTWLPQIPDWTSQTKGKLWYLYNPTLRFTEGAPMQGRPDDVDGEDGVEGSIYNDTAQPVMIRTTYYDDNAGKEYTSTAVLDPNSAGSFQIADSGTLEMFPNVSIKPGTGKVLGTTITSKGLYYLAPPTVRFEGGGGTGATGQVVMGNSQVQAVLITNPGSGYTTAPTMIFEGDGQEIASATATLGGEAISSETKPAKLFLYDPYYGWQKPGTEFTPKGGDKVVNKRTYEVNNSHYEIWGSTTLLVKRGSDDWTVPASDAYKNLYGDPNTRQTTDWAYFTIRIKSL